MKLGISGTKRTVRNKRVPKSRGQSVLYDIKEALFRLKLKKWRFREKKKMKGANLNFL